MMMLITLTFTVFLSRFLSGIRLFSQYFSVFPVSAIYKMSDISSVFFLLTVFQAFTRFVPWFLRFLGSLNFYDLPWALRLILYQDVATILVKQVFRRLRMASPFRRAQIAYCARTSA